MERRKKILFAVLVAAIITVPAVTIWLYQYQEDSSYGGAYKLAVDRYYSGNPLPKPYSVPASYYQFNLTGQVTVSYSLANYSYYRWINDSLGSFEIGISFGSFNRIQIYLPGAPPGAEIDPFVYMGIVSSNYSGYGFLGFVPTDLRTFDSFSSVGATNITSKFQPTTENLIPANTYFNTTTMNVTISTLGRYTNLDPLVPNGGIKISSMLPGQYYLSLSLRFYDILPLGNKYLGDVTITEPWVDVVL